MLASFPVLSWRTTFSSISLAGRHYNNSAPKVKDTPRLTRTASGELGSVFRCIRCPLDGWKCHVNQGWRRVLHSLWKSVLSDEAPSNSPAASANAAVGAVLIPSVPLAALRRRVYLSALKPVSSPAARRGRCDRVGGGALPTRARRGLRGERPWRRTCGATRGSRTH